jgi:hypothetical protein
MRVARSLSRWIIGPVSDRFVIWIEAYERAWRTAGTDGLHDLFADTATYRAGPFEDTHRGLEAIATFWEAEREGPDESFTLRFEIVVAQDDTAVARCEVRYGGPPHAHYRDLWIITLDSDGRCTAFEEWPFFPGQVLSASE